MLSERLAQLTEIVEKEFGGLNSTQLNWGHSAQRWSIGQCLEHIMATNKQYIHSLKRITTGSYSPTFWEKINPMTVYTGRQMIKTLGPVISKKYKSPLLFAPGKNVNQNITTEFKKIQDEIVQLFQTIERGKNSEKVITSPVALLITLKVNDVMNIIIVHEERHIQQALQIKNSETFPG